MAKPNSSVYWSLSRLKLSLLVVLIAIGCVWFASKWSAAKRQEQAIAALPGSVLFAHQHWEYDSLEGSVVESTPPGPAWLRRILGDSFFFVPSEVDLTLYKIHDDDLRWFKDLPSLRKVVLSNTPITDDALKYLVPLNGLEELNLRNTKLTSKAMGHLKSFAKLKVLIVPGFDQKTFDVEDLAVLSSFKDLEELVIDDNGLGDKGMSYLAGSTKMRVLRISNTKVPAGSFKHLDQMTAIEEVSASNVFINDEDIKSISNCTKLQTLIVEGRQLTSVACEVIATFHEMRYLNLWDFRLDDDNVKYVEGLKSLRNLNVESITPTALDRLKKALPQLAVTEYEKLRATPLNNLCYVALSIHKRGGRLSNGASQ